MRNMMEANSSSDTSETDTDCITDAGLFASHQRAHTQREGRREQDAGASFGTLSPTRHDTQTHTDTQTHADTLTDNDTQTWSQTHCDFQTHTETRTERHTETHRCIREIGRGKEEELAQGAGGEEKEKEKKKEEKKEEKLQKHEKEDKKKEKDLKAEKQEKEEKEEQEEELAAAREKNISSRWQADTQVLAPVACNKNEGITPKDRDSPSKNGGIISKDEDTPQTTPQTPSALDLLKSFNSSKTSCARGPDKVTRA